MSHLRVLIIGSGLGGLCLAQSLRRNPNVTFAVFERDTSPWDRAQGYRLHIDSDGVMALHQALPEALYKLFDATSMKAVDATTIVDTGLHVVKRLPSDAHGGSNPHAQAFGLPTHVNVNRATLRQILLTGLDDNLKYGKKFTHYEADASGVTAFFDDGSRERGDILVGADGIRSAVRKQRLPHALIQDTGVRAIYGRVPANVARNVVPQHAREDVFTAAIDSRKLFLGMGPVTFPQRPELASAQWMPRAQLQPQDDYVVSIVGGRKELWGHTDEALKRMDSAALQKLCVKVMQDWPETTRAVPLSGDPTSFFLVEMHTSVPCVLDTPTNVTLLGDAIHAMTPTLGRGANCAMRDGASLGRHVLQVTADERSLADSLRAYEVDMAAYGFDVVRKSATLGARLMGQAPLPT